MIKLKTKFVLVLFLAVCGIIVCGGCIVTEHVQRSLSLAIEEFLEKMTPIERQFFRDFYSGETCIPGSVKWLEVMCPELRGDLDECISAAESRVLFEYDSKFFPAQTDEGIIASSIAHMSQPAYIRKSGCRDYLEWFDVARVRRNSAIVPTAYFQYISWMDIEKERSATQHFLGIIERFEYQDNSWKLIELRKIDGNAPVLSH